MTAASPDLEYVLEHLVGGAGRWQWTRIVCLMPAFVAMSTPNLLHLFTAYKPGHRCFVDGCDEDVNYKKVEFDRPFLEFTVPKDKGGSNFLKEVDDFDPCLRFSPSSNSSPLTCVPATFSSIETESCDRYIYDTSEFTSTLTTELDLVCDNEGRRRLLGSVLMLSLTFGSFFGGKMVDRFGRRFSMYLGLAIVQPLIILGGLVGTNYWLYVFVRFVSCIFMVFGWVSVHTLQLEYFSKENRRVSYIVANFLGHTCNYVLPLVAYYNRDYYHMHLWTGLIGMLCLPMYWFTPESVRWLACNDRADEAEKQLLNIARVNGRSLSAPQMDTIRSVLQSVSKEAHLTKDTQLGVSDLFGHAFRKRTLSILSSWCFTILPYYALTLNVGDLSGDIFTNFIISMMPEYPAMLTCLFLLDRIGRRRLIIYGLIATSCCLVFMAFTPKTQTWLVLTTYLLGKYCLAVVGSTNWLYTAEIYPTNLRSQACGTCSMVSRIVTMSSTFLPLLSNIWPPLPMLVMGLPPLFAAWLVRGLPESAGRPLPETFQEAVDMDMWRGDENKGSGREDGGVYKRVPFNDIEPLILNAEDLESEED